MSRAVILESEVRLELEVIRARATKAAGRLLRKFGARVRLLSELPYVGEQFTSDASIRITTVADYRLVWVVEPRAVVVAGFIPAAQATAQYRLRRRLG